MRASEDPQDRAQCALLDALIAAAQGDATGTLERARDALAKIPAIGVRSEFAVKTWPPAIRAARALVDAEAVEELLALLDAHPVGHLPALLRAERDLAHARLAGDDDDPRADELLSKAVAALRRVAIPYNLAQSLLDHAEFLVTGGEPDRARHAVTEARALVDAHGARPLVDRADQIARALAIDVAIEPAAS